MLQGDPRAKLFVDTELAILKELNETIFGDKNLATAAGNLYKKILFTHLRNSPSFRPLREALVSQYSDFKSVRLALSRDTPELRGLIAKLHDTAALTYRRELARHGILPSFQERAFIAGRPENWHLTGYGGTADQAGFANRNARRFLRDSDPVHAMSFSEARETIEMDLGTWKRMQSSISRHVSHRDWFRAGLLDRVARDSYVLSAEAIDTIRKTPVEELPPALLKKFGAEVSPTDGLTLSRFVEFTNSSFSAGVFQAQRLEVHALEAPFGVFSADFAGQGARNTHQTMRMLTHPLVKNAESAVRAARRAERNATEAFARRQRDFSELIERAIRDGALPQGTRVHFSGDDGMVVLGGPLKQPEWASELLLRELAVSGDPSLRMVLSADGLPATARSRLIVRAEAYEKDLRKALAGRLPRERLNGMVFLIDLSDAPTLRIGGADDAERLLIQEEFSALVR